MTRILSHIALWLAFAAQVHGQELTASFSKSSIAIGEPLVLRLEVRMIDTAEAFVYRPHQSMIAAKTSDGDLLSVSATNYELEILQDFKDTLYPDQASFVWSGEYVLTAWDSAWVVLTPESIVLGDSLYYFQPLLLEVVSPTADPSKELYDIHEEFSDIDDALDVRSFLWWLMPSLVLLGILIYLVFGRKKKRQEMIALVPLRDRIMEQINTLEESKLYDTDLKEYYFQLSIIIRRFLAEHYHVSLMELTTVEIIALLRAQKVSSDTIQVIEKLLSQSDLVKFAKSKPPTSDAINNTNEARQIVDEVASLHLISPQE
jgi:hypothetical protein